MSNNSAEAVTTYLQLHDLTPFVAQPSEFQVRFRVIDWYTYAGTIGLFIFLFFLFIRLLPMISIFEVRTLLPESKVNGGPQS